MKPDTGPLANSWATVHLQIAQLFNEGELKDLITQLGGRWDYVLLSEDTLPEQALSVVMWVERHHLKSALLKLLRELRPDEEWPQPDIGK